MIWSYRWVKYFEQYPLWPKQIWAIKAMDSRTYNRGIFRLFNFVTLLSPLAQPPTCPTDRGRVTPQTGIS